MVFLHKFGLKRISREPPPLDQLNGRYRTAFDAATTNDPIKLIAGAREFLDNVTGSFHVVFATGSLAYGAMIKLSLLERSMDNSAVVTASEFQTREDIVEQAVRRGCKAVNLRSPNRIISIGDGVWDLKTADNLGYEFIGIGDGAKAVALKDMGARVFVDFTAVYRILGSNLTANSPVG